MSDAPLPPRASRHWLWLLMVFTLALYAATTSKLAVPEASADFLVAHLRLVPFPPMDRPLWGWLLRLLDATAPASIAWLANSMSVIMGALVVTLLARLVAGVAGHYRWSRMAPYLGPVAGLTAGMALAGCVPFWMVSNRAHPATLGLLLLMVALNLLQSYRYTGRTPLLVASAVAYAFGMAELPTMLLLAPAVAAYALFAMWRRQHMQPRRVLALALCFLITPAIWMVSAWDYYSLPAAGWREMRHYHDALFYLLLDCRNILLRSAPKQGWLILLFTSLLPWGVVAASVRRVTEPRVSTSYLVLIGLLTLLLVAQLFNVPLTPWRMMGTQPLLVTPYVLIASALGLLVLIFGLLLVKSVEWTQPQRIPWIPPALAAIALPILFAAIALNARQVHTRSARPAQALASAMLDHVQGRDMVVSAGMLAPHLMLQARERGLEITLLDVPNSAQPGYRRYLASLFTDPYQRSLAMVGLAPALCEWLSRDSRAEARLAMQTSPDFWLSEGFQPLPMGSVYLGASRIDPGMVAQARRVMSEFGPLAQRELAALQRTAPRLSAQVKAMSAYLARVANDTGVFFEHVGRPRSARQSYVQARALDPDNLSAAANLLVLGQASGWSGIDLVEADLALAVAPRDRPYQQTAARFGHLRRREAAQLVGSVDSPAADPIAPDPAWQEVLTAYARGDRLTARRLAETMIEKRPEFDPAWILLATLAYEQGDEKTVQKCVQQMRVVQREWPDLVLLLGRQALEKGDVPRARDMYERASLLRPGDLSILEILLQLDLQERDFRRAETRVQQILYQSPKSILGQVGLAQLLRHQKRTDLATTTLMQVLEVQRHPGALAELAAIQLEQGGTDAALVLAEEAVANGQRWAAAREIMGLTRYQMGVMKEARAELEMALALEPQRPRARLYLALLLQQEGESVEALRIAPALRKEKREWDPADETLLDRLPR